jgi:hypothetical protein
VTALSHMCRGASGVSENSTVGELPSRAPMLAVFHSAVARTSAVSLDPRVRPESAPDRTRESVGLWLAVSLMAAITYNARMLVTVHCFLGAGTEAPNFQGTKNRVSRTNGFGGGIV